MPIAYGAEVRLKVFLRSKCHGLNLREAGRRERIKPLRIGLEQQKLSAAAGRVACNKGETKMLERFEFLRFDDSGELKIKDLENNHWAWFAKDGSVLKRGTASEPEIEQWAKRVPGQFPL